MLNKFYLFETQFTCFVQALKILHNSPEFMPYVIFLAAPGMDQLKSIYENSRYSSRNLGTVKNVHNLIILERFVVYLSFGSKCFHLPHFVGLTSLIVPVPFVSVREEHELSNP